MTKSPQKCHICGSDCVKLLDKKILGKYTIDYFRCNKCNFIQTEKPFWLKEAYSSAIIDTDTGILSRNLSLSKITAIISIFVKRKKLKILDFAGGYGIMTRMLRDIGIDCYWTDKYAENIFAKPFVAKDKQNFDIVTCFEVFEHFENPLFEVESIIDKYNPKVIILSTMLHNGNPDTNWWYFAPEGGQHISLYSKESLKYTAKKYDYHFASNGRNIHIFSKRKVSSILLFLISIFWPFLSIFLPIFYKSKTFTDREMLC